MRNKIDNMMRKTTTATSNENVLVKEVGSCMVRLRFSEKPNPEVEKTVLYSLIDAFENRVKANDINTELCLN